MRFQFYRLAADGENHPVLQPVGHEFEHVAVQALGSLPEDARATINARFQMISKNHTLDEGGQLVLFSSTLGELPGAIVAIEVMDPHLRNPRRLQWAWGDSSTRIS